MNDVWSHQNKEWRQTLEIARKRGWPPPKKGTSHGVLTLKCPENAPGCQIKIFSTGAGTEDVARNSRKKIQRCPHGNFGDRFDQIDHLLENAERLLGAAAAELERRGVEAEAEALLQLAEDPLAEAAELLDADARYDAVAAAETELSGQRDELLRPGEAGSAPEKLIATAGTEIRRAKAELGDLPSASDRQVAVFDRLTKAQQERDRLRDLCT